MIYKAPTSINTGHMMQPTASGHVTDGVHTLHIGHLFCHMTNIKYTKIKVYGNFYF